MNEDDINQELIQRYSDECNTSTFCLTKEQSRVERYELFMKAVTDANLKYKED